MIAAVVPAAGRSERMAEPKLLFRIQGRSLIDRVVTALAEGGADRVIVVVPPADSEHGQEVAAEARRAGAEVVVPETRPAEMRDSIELGLERLAMESAPQDVLLLPGDSPGITAEIVAQVIQHASTLPDRIIIPTFEGKRGHPMSLPWSLALYVQDLPAGRGVNALVSQYRDRIVELPVASARINADIDTPDDVRRWNSRWPDETLEANDSRLPVADGRANPVEKNVVRVCFFALARQFAGCNELELELPHQGTVAGLRDTLRGRLPGLAALLPNVLIAVNEEYAGDDSIVPRGARIAVIPPVSGGSDNLREG
jgi:molybdenum cofactor cytidylyltransferase